MRNSGTLCGNLANGSPIGDALPVLIVLDAQLELRRGSRTRTLPLEKFYLGYQRNALEPGEFVVSVKVPVLQDARWISAYKVAKRFDQDISAVAVAVCIKVEANHVVAARMAFGGMAATATRAPCAERALLGAIWSKASVEAAVEKLAEDFMPLTDMRASSAYRLQVAGNLLRRFYLEHDGSTVATRTADVVSAATV